MKWNWKKPLAPQSTKEMVINEPLIRELCPVEKEWNDCYEWRFYEGYYHETHFSVENVNLSFVKTDQDGTTEDTLFEGAVLCCKDVCDPALDIALRGSGPDNQRDIKRKESEPRRDSLPLH